LIINPNHRHEHTMNTWLTCSIITVASWGTYGLLLHSGTTAMADPVNGRYKAFLLVGIAYFVTAVLLPALILHYRGASWVMPWNGIKYSFLAGVVGAVGAFFILVAFGAGGKPWVVMTVIFAGAPVINAIVSLIIHPPEKVPLPFCLGLILAIVGGSLVTYYKPKPGAAKTAIVAKANP
jgi:drug/metabolite transporter (DMT)-like permease